jgi:hypothetical protein
MVIADIVAEARSEAGIVKNVFCAPLEACVLPGDVKWVFPVVASADYPLLVERAPARSDWVEVAEATRRELVPRLDT